MHTSEKHVATFHQLIDEIAPSVHALHIVREDLLVDALQPSLGINNTALAQRIKEAAFYAGKSGASVVVCTCSTIGGVVEALNLKKKKQHITTTRIDRAMADTAAKIGAPILLVAALESTIAPSTALLQSSAAAIQSNLLITPLLLEKAWDYFLAGNQSAYIDAIVATVAKHMSYLSASMGDITPAISPARLNINSDLPRVSHTVVLAQASMREAVPPLAALGITALSSPELGVRHAVAVWMQQQSHSPATGK